MRVQTKPDEGAVHRFPCAGCGAEMAFDPKTGGMKCPYCGREQAIQTRPGVLAEHPLEAHADRLGRLSEGALQVTCDDCGATVAFEPPEVAGACPFCGAALVAQPKAADPLIAPEGVLPFAVTKKEAVGRIGAWLKSRWFAPNALKKMARQDGIGGVYLPFWTYDARTESRYSGERGEHYWETEYYDDRDEKGNVVRRSRQVMKTRWYPARGQVARDFDDVLIAASTSVAAGRLDALQPWDLEAVQPYEPAFLSGFKAQRYQVGLMDGFGSAKQVMASVIDSDVRADIGGDEQRVHGIDTQYFDVTFKHLLLPVWIAAYRFEKKVYQVIVNARTGEVQGARPYSFWKIAFLTLAVLAAIGLIVALRGSR